MTAGRFVWWLTSLLVLSGRCGTVVAATAEDARRDGPDGVGKLGTLGMMNKTRSDGMPGGRIGYETPSPSPRLVPAAGESGEQAHRQLSHECPATCYGINCDIFYATTASTTAPPWSHTSDATAAAAPATRPSLHPRTSCILRVAAAAAEAEVEVEGPQRMASTCTLHPKTSCILSVVAAAAEAEVEVEGPQRMASTCTLHPKTSCILSVVAEAAEAEAEVEGPQRMASTCTLQTSCILRVAAAAAAAATCIDMARAVRVKGKATTRARLTL
eukprot:CAMPEP_0119543196 /NCGR_PEP_ID=MMETSP1344-20130328/53989_1 /TAXON_ID=236787 /ORGANISM="Florenciella parvula, Strain CCMP2471" /LENGTH=271 /DNA_ID=CAMNT_0007587473 /DNA_START=180 /DNA_END=995 /DNA_ORIENTATION=+